MVQPSNKKRGVIISAKWAESTVEVEMGDEKLRNVCLFTKSWDISVPG